MELDQALRAGLAHGDQYYRTVRPMHREFVEPSKQWADLIIPEGGKNRVAVDVLLSRLRLAAS